MENDHVYSQIKQYMNMDRYDFRYILSKERRDYYIEYQKNREEHAILHRYTNEIKPKENLIMALVLASNYNEPPLIHNSSIFNIKSNEDIKYTRDVEFVKLEHIELQNKLSRLTISQLNELKCINKHEKDFYNFMNKLGDKFNINIEWLSDIIGEYLFEQPFAIFEISFCHKHRYTKKIRLQKLITYFDNFIIPTVMIPYNIHTLNTKIITYKKIDIKIKYKFIKTSMEIFKHFLKSNERFNIVPDIYVQYGVVTHDENEIKAVTHDENEIKAVTHDENEIKAVNKISCCLQ